MELKNRFFELSPAAQRKFQLKIAIGSLGIILGISLILFLIEPSLALIGIFAGAMILTIIAPFFDVPALVKKEKLKYHSLFLFAEEERKGKITLHGGTLFDYYFVLPKEMGGQERTRLILLEYLKGILSLIHQENEEIVVEGTSYFLNEQTAAKIGFSKVGTNWGQGVILAFNFFNLTASMSMAKKKLTFPNLSRAHTFRARISEIKQKEEFIKQLIQRLDRENNAKNSLAN